MKLNILFVMIMGLVGLALATSYSGDGSFNLTMNDKITSQNQVEITLLSIGTSYGRDQQPIYNNATYKIRYNNADVATVTLRQGDSYTAVARGGRRNATITLDNIWIKTSETTVALIRTIYANTSVESQSYDPPAPDVAITDIRANTSLFSAVVSWTTNTSANGTLYLYNSTRSSIMKMISISEMATSHSVNIDGLKSNYNYYVYVDACTNNSCVESAPDLKFTTQPVIPVISNVKAKEITNDSAKIVWDTDVTSDSIVYYRKFGESNWTRIPPKSSFVITDIVDNFPIDTHVIDPLGPITVPSIGGVGYTQTAKTINLESGERAEFALPSSIGSSSMIIPSKISIPSLGSSSSNVGSYDIVTDYPVGQIKDKNIYRYIFQQSHAMIIRHLEDNTLYQFKVSSCADACAESNVSTFQTNRTIFQPYVSILLSPYSIQHGSSAVITASAYSRNPGGTLVDTKVSWDDQGTEKSFTPVFGGNSKSFVPGTYDTLTVFSITFVDSGSHTVKLWVKDSSGKTNEQTVNVNVVANSACANTGAVYYPSDTTCTDKWPNDGQATINYNNGIGACHAFELCSNDLDYMAKDAESCCNGERIFSDQPSQNRGYGYDKNAACDVAIADTKGKGAMTSLGSDSSMKYCKAAYLVRGIGSQAIYVKDYYTAEACCKDASFCGNAGPRYQAYTPWPMSNIKYNVLWCYYYDNWIFGKSPKDGWYGSDTDPAANNNALADFPAHATVNTMNTGTCVDYSFVVTTSLRKIGFTKNQIMSARAPGHLYNLVWLPGDSKYSFIDTVGNTGGDFFTGPGWTWTADNAGQSHCTYNSDRCSNDGGMKNCPSKSQVYGC